MKKISCLGASAGAMLESVRILNRPKNKIVAGKIHNLMVFSIQEFMPLPTLFVAS